jgi:hypothetical protein
MTRSSAKKKEAGDVDDDQTSESEDDLTQYDSNLLSKKNGDNSKKKLGRTPLKEKKLQPTKSLAKKSKKMNKSNLKVEKKKRIDLEENIDKKKAIKELNTDQDSEATDAEPRTSPRLRGRDSNKNSVISSDDEHSVSEFSDSEEEEDQSSQVTEQSESEAHDTSNSDVSVCSTRKVVIRKKVKMQGARRMKRSPRKIMALQLATRQLELNENSTDFEKASQRLHVCAVPDSLPCREEEFLELYSHVASAIQEGSGFCIYVSGVPGTGKTATFKAVLRQLQAEVDQDVH